MYCLDYGYPRGGHTGRKRQRSRGRCCRPATFNDYDDYDMNNNGDSRCSRRSSQFPIGTPYSMSKNPKRNPASSSDEEEVPQPNTTKCASVCLPADIGETKDSYIIYIDVPGVSKEGVTLTVSSDNATLQLTCRRSALHSLDEKVLSFKSEIPNDQTMSRHFAIPKDADVSKIKANVENGVLRICVPKIVSRSFTIPLGTAPCSSSSLTSSPKFVLPPDSELTPLTYDGGVKYIVLRRGHGMKAAEKGDTITAHISVFDSKGEIILSTRESRPLTFKIGAGHVFKGLEKACLAMREGELSGFSCTSAYLQQPVNGQKLFDPPAAGVLQLEVEILFVDADITDITKDGGLTKRVILEGKGERVTDDCQVLVNFKAINQSGTCLEASQALYRIGENKLPIGLEAGLLTMRRGDVCMLTITPEYLNLLGTTNGDSSKKETEPVRYHVALLEVIPAVPSDRLTVPERIKLSEHKRLQGNKLYEHKLMKAALSKYCRALELISCEEGMSQDEKIQVKTQTIKCDLNCAACYLALKLPKQACEHCDKALSRDINNLRGFLRRGRCFTALGEWEKAQKDFNAALQIDPNNEEAKKELMNLTKAKENATKMERRMFANMLKSLGNAEGQ